MIARLLSDIFSGVWLIDPQRASSYIPFIQSLLEGKIDASLFDVSKLKNESNPRFAVQSGSAYTISEYAESKPPEKAPKDSVAIINISDVIYKYDQACGPAGMQTKGDILTRCFNEDKIKAVVLNIDSPGGEAFAAFNFSAIIDQRNKPVIGFVDDLAASAAYEIISSCDHVVANTSEAQIGSIGTYITIADFEKYYEKMGIKLHEIYASKSVDKNKNYYDALKGDYKGIIERADRVNEKFLSDVKKHRSGKIGEEKEWGTGKVFFADKALTIGLIDEIDSFDNVLLKLLN